MIWMFAINSQADYEHRLGDQLNSNPKLFHSYIKHRKTNQPIRRSDWNLTDNPKEMAEFFANSFVSIFSSTALSEHPSLHQVSPRIIQESRAIPVCRMWPIPQMLLVGRWFYHQWSWYMLACKVERHRWCWLVNNVNIRKNRPEIPKMRNFWM